MAVISVGCSKNETETRKVKCPHCGYEMPIRIDEDAECHGVYVKCKGRGCKKEFEIRVIK